MADVDLKLTVGPAAAAAARRALDAFDATIPGRVAEDLRLLVTELVTNSVRHAGLQEDDPIRLRVRRMPDGIRVEVADEGLGFRPRVRQRPAEEPSGWGLYLVDRLADRWGVEDGNRTLVWFEIDA